MSQEKIFHLSHRNISKGKYNVGSRMAYSTGIEINDEKTGKSYHKEEKEIREGIETEMVLNDAASEKFKDTNYFYNKMMGVEKRTDARVFNEMDVALFQELKPEENKELARQFCKDFSEKYNTPVSLSFHKLDSHNPHCHIIYSERGVDGEEFSKTKNKEMRSKGYLKTPRKMWADRANAYFKEKEKDLFIDHRSNKERGLEQEPTTRYNKHSEIQNYKTVKLENKVIKSQNKQIEYHNKHREKKKEREAKVIAIKQIRGKEVKPMAEQKVLTVHRLYQNEIDKRESKFLEKRKEYKAQKERNKEHKETFKQRKQLHREQLQKSRNTLNLKRGDVMDLRFEQKGLKADLKGYSKINPFTWKERKAIKQKIAHNKVKQKKKKYEMKKEKSKMKVQKRNLKGHRKEFNKEKRKEYGLLKDQILNKFKAKALVKEKANVKNKKLDNTKVVSLKDFKKTNKVEKIQSKNKGRAI